MYFSEWCEEISDSRNEYDVMNGGGQKTVLEINNEKSQSKSWALESSMVLEVDWQKNFLIVDLILLGAKAPSRHLSNTIIWDYKELYT